MVNALNFIMKSVVFFFPCLKDSIFHSSSAAFVLSLNVVLIYLTKSSQSWVLSSSSSSLSFLCVYMSATPPLRWAKITMILLFLRNNCIPLHQSLNFVQLLSNHSGSSTMFFSIPVYMFSLIAAGVGATDISVSNLSWLFEVSSVICKDPSCSDNASISFILLKLVLVPLHSLYYTCFV